MLADTNERSRDSTAAQMDIKLERRHRNILVVIRRVVGDNLVALFEPITLPLDVLSPFDASR